MLDPITRRKVLISAVAFFALTTTPFGPQALRLAKAFAQAGGVDPATRSAMVRMARLLYPHAAIPDAVYAEVLDKALTSVAGSPAFANAFKAAEQALNAQQQRAWIDLDEPAQIAAMKAIEQRDFFVAILMAVQADFYNHPAVWAHLGYEGSSFEKGGYIGRGAGVVDWLPGG